ncbi:hypothetical protein LYNGBM3L_24570 [Moorena producens 3L]|uniref:Tetratricopeptide repeat protein n=1 Tax=Moorena producens 3L TaxID=489825 RepID=F4XNM2_9CYAN|nr:hypothetical protein LYNGBM3L_24570 [Moorena producens 3L]
MLKKLLGQQHPSVAKSLNNLALLYSKQYKKIAIKVGWAK